MVIVFAGSPAAAVPSLEALAASRHDVAAVLTREDSPQGRRRELTPTAVAASATELGLPIIRANRLAGAATEAVTALRPDLGVIVAYGGLVREPLLTVPRLGWINLHFSLLPRWRGAAPVQRAIIAGDEVSGASVFQLVAELDAGDVYGQFTQAIGANETAGHLLESLSVGGAELLVRVVNSLADGVARAEPQVGDVTLAPKLDLPDARLDFGQHASTVLDRVRGVTPEPGAFTVVDEMRIKILEAVIARDELRLATGQLELRDGRVVVGTASDPIELVSVQPAGKKAMRAADWWRGRPSDAGTLAR
ncbi:methionyl-tRNA formyltransferase [Glaciihabitans sp. GrIS 2.15]|uniref:methionyl-tRNA formyltransferase n=1 Tax=Glaciihabitans sp. GrIS 2.15 TaxID=3071710 RepID=UPI002E0F8D6D